MLLWSMGLFVLGYGFQGPLAMLLGVTNTAAVLFIFLAIAVVCAAWSMYVLYGEEARGLAAFGIVSVTLLVVLLLTRYQFLGLLLALAYDAAAIGKLFKLARRNSRA